MVTASEARPREGSAEPEARPAEPFWNAVPASALFARKGNRTATRRMDRAAQSRMRQQMVSWLSNAHAMEMQAIQILENQARRIESYVELQTRILEHLEETRGQLEKVERCIERYGSTPSRLKDAGAMFIGNVQALGGAFMPDEVVKGSIMSYAFEHLEIACYRSLIGAAEELGDAETAGVCTGILREEEAMADWLEQRLPGLSRDFLRRQRAGQQAKR